MFRISATRALSDNNLANTNKIDATQIVALDLWCADIPTEHFPDGSVIKFTIVWKDAQHNEGKNCSVVINGSE